MVIKIITVRKQYEKGTYYNKICTQYTIHTIHTQNIIVKLKV